MRQIRQYLDTVYAVLNRSNTFDGDLIPKVTETYDLGTVTLKWNTIHAASITGGTISGAEWEYAGNMLIDPNSASGHTTLFIENQDGTYEANLDVERNIIVGGTVDGIDIGTNAMLLDGTKGLSADWDAGAHEIRAETFQSDVGGGTAPFIVASTTLVSNLNVDQVDGLDGSDIAEVAGTETITGAWTFDRDPAAPFIVVSGSAVVANLDADKLDGYDEPAFSRIAAIATITGLWTFDRDVSAPFAVTANSAVVTNLDSDKLDGYEASAFPRKAEDASISGAWTISNDLIIDGDLDFTGAQSIATTADNLTLAPAGDIVLSPTGADVLPGTAYTVNLGAYTNKYLTLHVAELQVSTLVAEDVLATIGGRILVGPTSRLTANITDVVTTIYLEHDSFASGDYLLLEANGNYEQMVLVSGAGAGPPYPYTVTRNQDLSGGNPWYAGDAVFNMGASGDGWIDIYSQRGVESGGYGPTIVGNQTYTSGTWNEVWALGNLNGLYGYVADTYGIGLGMYSASDYMTIDTADGIRFFNSTDQVIGQIDTGAWTIGRVTTSYSNIQIVAGAIKLRTNITAHMELTTAGTFWAGDTNATERIQWDTTNGLQIYNAGNLSVFKVDISGAAFFTNKIQVLDAAGALAFGLVATIPTSATVGTGIWIDRTGIYGLNANTQEFYLDATDGTAYAGGGAVILDSDGILLDGDSSAYSSPSALKWYGSGGLSDVITNFYNYDNGSDIFSKYVIQKLSRDIQMEFTTTAGTTSQGSSILLSADAGATGASLRISGGYLTAPAQASFSGDCQVFINDSQNPKNLLGLTINQGASDDEILSLKSSDVAHGMTTNTETDTFGTLIKCEAASGGLSVNGYKDADGFAGVALRALGRLGEAADTTKSTAGRGVVELVGQVISGTTVTTVGSNGNVIAFRNSGTTIFIFDAEGSAHADVEWIAFDEHDDVALLDVLEGAMVEKRDVVKEEFSEFLTGNRRMLEELGLVHFDEQNPTHAMLNTTRLSMLLVGAARQLATRVERLEAILPH